MFAEPLTDFFDVQGGFAEDATWSVGPATVQVIFDNEFFLQFLGIIGVEGSEPRAYARAAQLPAVARGQTLTIRGTAYSIVGVRPDGQGLLELVLREP